MSNATRYEEHRIDLSAVGGVGSSADNKDTPGLYGLLHSINVINGTVAITATLTIKEQRVTAADEETYLALPAGYTDGLKMPRAVSHSTSGVAGSSSELFVLTGRPINVALALADSGDDVAVIIKILR